MPDYPISPEALEAAATSLDSAFPEYEETLKGIDSHHARAAINAFLEAEEFQVEENVLPTTYEKRLVGKWRAFEG